MDVMQKRYKETAVPGMQKKFGYANVMAVPRIEKTVVNTGFGRVVSQRTGEDYRKTLDGFLNDLSAVAGQRAVTTKAKRSIAGFKLREGSPVGAKVTLRGKRMYDFLDRLLSIVLPRSRDFRGLNLSSVDERGNLSVGITDHIFFPEISPEHVKDMFGLQVTVQTSCHTKEEGVELFRLLGFPLKQE